MKRRERVEQEIASLLPNRDVREGITVIAGDDDEAHRHRVEQLLALQLELSLDIRKLLKALLAQETSKADL